MTAERARLALGAMENELTNESSDFNEAEIRADQSRDTGSPAHSDALGQGSNGAASDVEAEGVTVEADESGETDLAAQAAEQTRKAVIKASVEAIVYVAEEPVTSDQIVAALAASNGVPAATLKQNVLEAISLLQAECGKTDRGLEIREIAGGYKMFTKAEHHDVIRQFVKNLTPPLKLSMAALETLATIAYKQPITLPEIQQIRGVNAGGTVKTLLDRKLITTAGRKNVIGRPILYKTTKEFLVKFGLSGLSELPTLEEFGELALAALGEVAAASESEFTPEGTEDTTESAEFTAETAENTEENNS